MEKKSLKLNFLMNTILTCSSFLFPLVTFPYISRVLLPEGNGKINFATSIINYFSMIAMLGIPMYGIRACALVRDNKNKLSRTVSELFTINLIMVIVAYILLFITIFFVPKLQEEQMTLLILSTSIFLNMIGMEWFFQALEEYSYITIRSIVFKILSIILMFIFVQKSSDYWRYAIITVFATGGASVLNYCRVKKYINQNTLFRINFKQHIKPIFSFFLVSISWTLYTNLDTIMLGFMSDDVQVGYYGAAIKIKGILVTFVSALGTVLMPRITNYYNENKKDEIQKLLRKNSSFIILTSLALIMYFVINAKETILFISGNDYLPAVSSMRIIMFSILLVGLSTMTGSNILIPQGKEKLIVLATTIGIVVDVLINILLIPQYGAAGAALATVLGELIILFIEFLYLKDIIRQFFSISSILKIFSSLLISVFILLFFKISISISNNFIYICVSGVIFGISYIILLLIFKETLLWSIITPSLDKIKNLFIKWYH